MKNNNKIIIAVIGVIVVVVLLAWYFGNNSGVGYKSGSSDNGGATGKSETRETVTSDVTVPGSTSTVSADVAKPVTVAPAAPGSASSLRKFSLSVSGGKFIPETVIVNEGDTVNLSITAADKDYDFYQPDLGLSSPLPKGQPKTVEFQATSQDKYTFYCKSCGGPDKGPVGYVVVVPLKK